MPDLLRVYVYPDGFESAATLHPNVRRKHIRKRTAKAGISIPAAIPVMVYYRAGDLYYLVQEEEFQIGEV